LETSWLCLKRPALDDLHGIAVQIAEECPNVSIPRVTALVVDPGFLQLVAIVQFCSTGIADLLRVLAATAGVRPTRRWRKADSNR
jgi:hypothetical protein